MYGYVYMCCLYFKILVTNSCKYMVNLTNLEVFVISVSVIHWIRVVCSETSKSLTMFSHSFIQ